MNYQGNKASKPVVSAWKKRKSFIGGSDFRIIYKHLIPQTRVVGARVSEFREGFEPRNEDDVIDVKTAGYSLLQFRC
jgi:hypothetical protein